MQEHNIIDGYESVLIWQILFPLGRSIAIQDMLEVLC